MDGDGAPQVSTAPLAALADAQAEALAAFDPLARIGFLATASGRGQVRNRPLVLRRVAADGVEITTSATSPKWHELAGREAWELVVYWPSLRRSFRLRGADQALLSPARLAELWNERARPAQLLEHAYQVIAPLSSTLPDRSIFVDGMERLGIEHPPSEALPIPAAFVGVRLLPEEVEDWRESESALHERTLWRRAPGQPIEAPGSWTTHLLMP